MTIVSAGPSPALDKTDMNGAFYIAATGLQSEQTALDVIANNIANINTPGFKRSQARFSELVSPLDKSLSPAGPQAADALSGVMSDASARVFTQGILQQTNNSTDIAINGDGFIELLGAGGQTMLWRGGTLKVNSDGNLAASNDMPLKAQISVPAGFTALTIDQSGRVTATVQGATQAIGQIDLLMPKDPSQLKDMGSGLYQAATGAQVVSVAPGEEGGGVIVQGQIEGSNVQLSDEMVTLMLIQRAYAANAQVVQAGDQLMGIANGLKR
jgi:flagellar basal-body rod protein FlgG